jgi:hypothetical protein
MFIVLVAIHGIIFFIFIVFINTVFFVRLFIPCHIHQHVRLSRSVSRGKNEKGNLKPLVAIRNGGDAHDLMMI